MMKGGVRHQRPYHRHPHNSRPNNNNNSNINNNSNPQNQPNSTNSNITNSIATGNDAQPKTNDQSTVTNSNSSYHNPNKTRLWELRKKPTTREDRQTGKIVIHRVPDETTEEEISELLRGWIFDISIKSINFMRPKGPDTRTGLLTVKAFVEFASDEWADRIINCYEQHKSRLGKDAYCFTNAKDITSELIFEYCLKVKEKPFFNKNNNYVNNNHNSNKNMSNGSDRRGNVRSGSDDAKSSDAMQNVIEDIATIKRERALFLDSIQKMEAELEKRMPGMFVSEFELNALRREDYELNEKIKAQCVALESGRQMLRGVQEDLEQLNKLYNEDLEDEMSQLKLNSNPAAGQ